MGEDDRSIIRFAEKAMALLDKGDFTATYKYAVLLALMDLCLEQSARDGSPPTMVTSAQVARKILELYWRHATPFEGRVLLQNRGQQAKIVTLIARYRERHAADPGASLFRSMTDDRAPLRKLEREIEWKLVEMPLPKLQRVGRSVDDFIYTIGWDDRVTHAQFESADFDNRLAFRPGASQRLVDLASVLRPLVYRHWVLMVTRLNGMAESTIEDHLFGPRRTAVATVCAPLLELQGGLCFYCGARVQSEPHVDHFLPWARHADDGVPNLVAAHAKCNGAKSDFLAEAGHVRRWATRLVERAGELAVIASEAGWEHEPDRTARVVRAMYCNLPDDIRLWHLAKEFVPLDRAALNEAFAPLATVA